MLSWITSRRWRWPRSSPLFSSFRVQPRVLASCAAGTLRLTCSRGERRRALPREHEDAEQHRDREENRLLQLHAALARPVDGVHLARGGDVRHRLRRRRAGAALSSSHFTPVTRVCSFTRGIAALHRFQSKEPCLVRCPISILAMWRLCAAILVLQLPISAGERVEVTPKGGFESDRERRALTALPEAGASKQEP